MAGRDEALLALESIEPIFGVKELIAVSAMEIILRDSAPYPETDVVRTNPRKRCSFSAHHFASQTTCSALATASW